MERDSIIARLIAVARQATPEDLVHIASLDRHESPEGTERHRATLEQIIFDSDRIMTDEHYWYPSEAVELCAYVWDAGHERAFAVATSLLMAKSLTDEDGMGHMEFRWAGLHRHYAHMKMEFREPILAGFCWLSHLDDWDYLSGAGKKLRIDPGSVPHPVDVYRETCSATDTSSST